MARRASQPSAGESTPAAPLGRRRLCPLIRPQHGRSGESERGSHPCAGRPSSARCRRQRSPRGRSSPSEARCSSHRPASRPRPRRRVDALLFSAQRPRHGRSGESECRSAQDASGRPAAGESEARQARRVAPASGWRVGKRAPFGALHCRWLPASSHRPNRPEGGSDRDGSPKGRDAASSRLGAPVREPGPSPREGVALPFRPACERAHSL